MCIEPTGNMASRTFCNASSIYAVQFQTWQQDPLRRKHCLLSSHPAHQTFSFVISSFNPASFADLISGNEYQPLEMSGSATFFSFRIHLCWIREEHSPSSVDRDERLGVRRCSTNHVSFAIQINDCWSGWMRSHQPKPVNHLALQVF